MAALYVHLFNGGGCEGPRCANQDTDLYPTRGGRGLVRACSPLCARQARESRCWWCGGLGSEHEPLVEVPTAYNAAGAPVMPMLSVHRSCERSER